MNPFEYDKSRRVGDDRRKTCDRRLNTPVSAQDMRAASWPDQKMQFITRYGFWILGILFFNFIIGVEPVHWSVWQINTAFGVYILIHGFLLLHAKKYLYHPTRFRIAMWADISIVSITVLNDPNVIPPTLLVYLMIVLGNGMRYGMKMFAEGLMGSLICGSLIVAARNILGSQDISVGLVFFALFSATILIYSYILMGRIDASRLELEKNSKYDSLTGLYNRRALLDIADIMFQRLKRHRQQRFVMLFADLDGFKTINDTLGHAQGDRVLRSFADIIRNATRNVDIPARFGGDEFIILLDDTDIAEAEFIVSRIQKDLNQWARENTVKLSASFGVGEAPTHGRTFSVLLDQVDKALYRSKSTVTKGGCVQASPPVLVVNNS